VLIHPDIKSSYGLLGTTFGGNHLACAAGLAVLEVIENEDLLSLAKKSGEYLKTRLNNLEGITEIRGRGLMIGMDFAVEAGPIRTDLINRYRIFTGSSAGKNTIRLLPPLNIEIKDLTLFLESLQQILALNKV
jgi:acetylornithine aminotransferase